MLPFQAVQRTTRHKAGVSLEGYSSWCVQDPEERASCRMAAYGVVKVAYESVPPHLLKNRIMESVGGNKVSSSSNDITPSCHSAH